MVVEQQSEKNDQEFSGKDFNENAVSGSEASSKESSMCPSSKPSEETEASDDKVNYLFKASIHSRKMISIPLAILLSNIAFYKRVKTLPDL